MKNFISYKKTILGWYNFTEEGVLEYNVNPITFRLITGVSEHAALGVCEVDTEQLDALKEKAIFIGLANGWEVVASDAEASNVS